MKFALLVTLRSGKFKNGCQESIVKSDTYVVGDVTQVSHYEIHYGRGAPLGPRPRLPETPKLNFPNDFAKNNGGPQWEDPDLDAGGDEPQGARP